MSIFKSRKPTKEQEAIRKIMYDKKVVIELLYIPHRYPKDTRPQEMQRKWLFQLYQQVSMGDWVERHEGRYSEGSGHCEGLSGMKTGTVAYQEYVRHECESGVNLHGNPVAKPDPADVLWSLCMDASTCISSPTFEEFCSEFGYDTDSRAALSTWDECRKTYNALVESISLAGIEAVLEVEM